MVRHRADFSSPLLVSLVARPVGHFLERGDGPLSGGAEGPQGIPKHNGGEQVAVVLRPGGVRTQTMNDRTLYEDTYLCFVHACVQVCARRSSGTFTAATSL